jgi:hypothetical protein
MTDITISALPAATTAAGTDVFPIVQSGVTKQLTNTKLFTNAVITTPTLTSPTMTAPVLGTVASGVISACTSSGMVLTAPVLGTPASGVLDNCTGSPTLTNIKFSGLAATTAAAPTIASATTIAPTKPITFISGTTAVVTITAPSPISVGGGTIILIPTGAFTWTAAGNIAVLGTAVVNKALSLTYDVTTTKWYPSYV